MTYKYKYLDLILGLFVAVLLISNIASAAKIVDLGMFAGRPMIFDAGTLIFPLSYIFSDVLTEVYGYAVSRRVIWIGFISLFLMSAVLILVGVMPGEAGWLSTNAMGDNAAATFGQDAFDKVLGLTWRIMLGSLLAYWCGSFTNDYVLAKLKVRTEGQLLWLRTIGSTLIGEGIDTLVFALVAFWGVLPNEILIDLIIANYIFKVGVEIIFTPLTYWVVNRLKRVEHQDYFDRNTDFNPFKLGAS
ncbi:MAG: queuosine precursor transporter [Chloroflexi bacterium]|nr:queuosine precursor transporter [Chloroflexota bacterium]